MPSNIAFRERPKLKLLLNLTAARISSRDGGSGLVLKDMTNAFSSLFVDAAQSDLRLQPTARPVIDQAPFPIAMNDDFDGELRPTDGHNSRDLGADEILQKNR